MSGAGYVGIPCSEVRAALRGLTEATYALDELRADGVVVLANSEGTYLGDRRFDPLLEELDRRGAVVFNAPSTSGKVTVAQKPKRVGSARTTLAQNSFSSLASEGRRSTAAGSTPGVDTDRIAVSTPISSMRRSESAALQSGIARPPADSPCV
ncbi:amidohydrolase family protein [Mycolicibacterium rutilum]|uniref:hypothetical protein n=1 Tax=Mycolicibacterium rutilum TaxID=370526 RepID=UPI0009F6D086|nr:hypothetical protein [Mycolicibacterium rutilum]